MRTTLVFALASALAFAPGAHAALTKDQQGCVNQLNKDFAKLSKTLGKELTGCIKDHNKGKNGITDISACLAQDRKGKVAKAQVKTEADETQHCAGSDGDGEPRTPEVFFAGASAIEQATLAKENALLEVLYGSDLASGALSEAEDRDAAKCQEAVAKSVTKCQAAQLKAFTTCKKAALAVGQSPFPSGATTNAELETCIGADPKGKIAKTCDLVAGTKVDKIRKDLDKKCVAHDVDLALALPDCAAADSEAVHSCLEQAVICLSCEAINAADSLTANCDRLDNGVEDRSCSAGLAIGQETFDIPSTAQPAETPGTPGASVTNPNLVTQFGGASFDLNRARYTRYFLDLDPPPAPDGVLILVPGFEGGAGTFHILAENLIRRTFRDKDLVVELWAFDRRTNQLEDSAGLDIAEGLLDAQVALDWLYGGELGLTLHPALAAGPNRRAFFHNTSSDIAFIGNWTSLVHSHDIDAVVNAALAVTPDVFLGGHSAGTGFTARYAATDFNLTGVGAPQPGYAKLKGLVLLEGGGASTAGAPVSAATLDRIEDRFDGGVFHAVQNAADSCVDGTLCASDPDCAGKGKGTCTPTRAAYSIVPGLLNPRILAAVEPVALQGMTDPDSGKVILLVDQGAAGNNAIAIVPDLSTLSLLPPSTVFGGLGSFLDDDGLVAAAATFVATSVGLGGPQVGGLLTWQTASETIPPAAFTDNGPAPTSLPAGRWGVEQEATSLDRMLPVFFQGGTNFTDWYYPSAGLSVTSGLPSLDSSALSVGRGRRDIENLTQAASIDIPVICLGGSNGLTPIPQSFLAFAQSIGACSAPSCSGGTPRVVDALNPNPAFPTYGAVAGGFEVHISVGYSHVDIVTTEDNAGNAVVGPIVEFLARNLP